MQNKESIVISNERDPYYNLALEEYLLRSIHEEEIIFYLWQNEHTIVIGRNQNIYNECRVKPFMESGGKIARRLSGGGSVYHDLGNLNFTFLMREDNQDLQKQLKVILEAVNSFGLNAEFSGRNDLTIDGKKFSGNAFYNEDGFYYHHGTILVDANLDVLSKYLQVSKDKIESKGIESVKARVSNLRDIKSDITIDKMKNTLIHEFKQAYCMLNQKLDVKDSSIFKVNDLYEKYASWDWIFGETPDYNIQFSKRFSWGKVDIYFEVENGYIKNLKIYSDSLEPTLMLMLERYLSGLPFSSRSIDKLNKELIVDKGKEIILTDILDLLREKII